MWESVDGVIGRTRREWLRYESGVQPHDLMWAELVSYVFGGHASIQA
jgi:hypothetical protein